MQKPSHAWAFVSTLTGAFLALATTPLATAHAYDLEVTDEIKLSLNVNVAGGFRLEDPLDETEDTTFEPYLRMGRLQVRAKLTDVGSVMVQTDFAPSGNVRLLDAVASLTPVPEVELRAGLFKTPISADFLIPLPRHPRVNRPGLFRRAPRRRLGADVTFHLPLAEHVTLDLDAGLFAGEGLEEGDDGKLLASRAALRLAEGWTIHAAYGQLVFSDNAINPDTGGRPMPYDRLLDGAIIFEDAHWYAHAEALFVFDGPTHDHPFGATALLSHTFGERSDELAVQPAVSWEVWHEGGVDTHVFTGAANLLVHHAMFVPRLDYELRLDETGRVGHAVFLELQASI